MGSIDVTLWKPRKEGSSRSVGIRKGFKDKTGKWQETKVYLFENELPILQAALKEIAEKANAQ
jgi:hypothetical protein